MALLHKGRNTPSEATPDAPDGPAVKGPGFACHSCGAAMKARQDWCLDCGTAAPGRLHTRSGWRAAFSVVAVTLLFVGGAVTAGYAALSSDAERTAPAALAAGGEPIPATPAPGVAAAPITPGAAGPDVAPPAAAAPSAVLPPATGKPPVGTPIIPVKPPAPAKNTPVEPPAATDEPPAASKTPSTDQTPSTSGTAASKPKLEIVTFEKGAASTYDPGTRAGAEFGPAMNAIDKSKNTVWDITVPADDKPIGAGLLVDLGKPRDLRALRLATPTEGFRVEIYGAQDGDEVPEDIVDKRWEHITDIASVKDGKLVTLLGKSKVKQQLLLFYITTPANPRDPRAAIGDVAVAVKP